MLYNVTVKALNPNIEEEVLIEIDNIELTCFVTYWSKNIKIGGTYKADIGITVLDDILMTEQKDVSNTHFFQEGNTFAYIIRGKFDFASRTVDARIKIYLDEEEVDLYDFAYLDGKNVEFKVDRITLEFFD